MLVREAGPREQLEDGHRVVGAQIELHGGEPEALAPAVAPPDGPPQGGGLFEGADGDEVVKLDDQLGVGPQPGIGSEHLEVDEGAVEVSLQGAQGQLVGPPCTAQRVPEAMMASARASASP